MSAFEILSPELRQVLGMAGWSERWDASANTTTWSRELAGFTSFPAAERALRRYGGLRVHLTGRGEERAKESFELNPLLALGEEDRFERHALRLGVPLYPLGEAGNGHVFLAIAPDGRVFALMEDLWLVGNGMEHALETLVLGRSPGHLPD